MVQREAGLMDRAQARAPRPAPSPFQMFDRGLPPPPPDADAMEAQEEARGQDATVQRALKQAVEALKGAVRENGGKVPPGLDDASRDMQAATDALTAGQEGVAHTAEGRAIDDLRKGGQQMQRDREANRQLAVVPGARQPGEEGEEEGSEGGDQDGTERDPLGRPLKQGVGGEGAADMAGQVARAAANEQKFFGSFFQKRTFFLRFVTPGSNAHIGRSRRRYNLKLWVLGTAGSFIAVTAEFARWRTDEGRRR
jgi:hypothetical protein